MTPKLMRQYFEAYQKRTEDQLVLLDTANHILGGYIRTAIGDALGGRSDYPDEPLVKRHLEDSSSDEMSDEDMLRMAQRNTAMIAGRLRKGHDE